MTVAKSKLRVGQIVRVDDFPNTHGDYPENRRVFVVYLGPGLDESTFLAAGISTLHGGNSPDGGLELPFRQDGHPQTSLNRRSAVYFNWVHPVDVAQVIEVTGYCPPLKLHAVLAGVQSQVAQVLTATSNASDSSASET